jgi:hypothetical protein
MRVRKHAVQRLHNRLTNIAPDIRDESLDLSSLPAQMGVTILLRFQGKIWSAMAALAAGREFSEPSDAHDVCIPMKSRQLRWQGSAVFVFWRRMPDEPAFADRV